MTSVRLPEEMEARLDHLCEITKRSKSFYLKEALSYYLDDMEDAYIALERVSLNPREKTYTTEEVLKRLRERPDV